MLIEKFLENAGFTVWEVFQDKKEYRVSFFPEQFQLFSTPIMFEFVDRQSGSPVVEYSIENSEQVFSISWENFLNRIQS